MSISRVLTFAAASTLISALALAQTPTAPAAPAAPAVPAAAPPAAAAPAAAAAAAPPAAAMAMEIPANSPCTQDVDAFCKGMMPGEGAILGCLSDHSAHLSHTCKTHMEQLKQQYLASASDCEPDIKSFCATVPQGSGRIMKCLKKHSKELSAPCKALAAKLKETALAPMAAAAPTPAAAPMPPAAAAPAAAAPAAPAAPAKK